MTKNPIEARSTANMPDGCPSTADERSRVSSFSHDSTSAPISTPAESEYDESPPVIDRLPSYQTATRDHGVEDATAIITQQSQLDDAATQQYARDLRHLDMRLKASISRREPRDEMLLQQLKRVSTVDETPHVLIACRIADMLGVFPSQEAVDEDSVSQRLAMYSMDSLTAVRLASWTERSLRVKMTPVDFINADVQTLDDAARLIAAKVQGALPDARARSRKK